MFDRMQDNDSTIYITFTGEEFQLEYYIIYSESEHNKFLEGRKILEKFGFSELDYMQNEWVKKEFAWAFPTEPFIRPDELPRKRNLKFAKLDDALKKVMEIYRDRNIPI